MDKELLYSIRRKNDGLFMHSNSLSWSERGNMIRSLEESKNISFWFKLDKENYEIVEYSLKEEQVYEIV